MVPFTEWIAEHFPRGGTPIGRRADRRRRRFASASRSHVPVRPKP